MSYTNEPGAYREESVAYGTNPSQRVADVAPVAVTGYHDLVRWGPIFAGLVVAIASQLVLTALGAAVGLTNIAGSDAAQSNAGDVGTAVGIWSIISLLIALFLGGYVTSRACGPMNRKTALLNGAILWATTLAVSAWLLSSGVAGAFGLAAQGADAVINQVPSIDALPDAAQNPNVTQEQAQNIAGNAAKVGWSFALGSLLGLVAALAGAATGARSPRAVGAAPR
ncbi:MULTISPECIES: hypothetical protein [Cyanophyceae]|uniref:hypothetical protein n=1 Tax=Cyanophyceae TaxID=3028117 RepID=UPI001688F73F|nr:MULTISPECIES: hypothetical protein [Cyanophyceae]MBD1916981.1 hypothetical protein [Phormidium sp. FACHB-77]MBD2029832.1 hypothetical protein [Phormidium sp. FACHB-322]MBD2050380.1 hypothetical protein [Leptolyngbya sp. FACHB-60]